MNFVIFLKICIALGYYCYVTAVICLFLLAVTMTAFKTVILCSKGKWKERMRKLKGTFFFLLLKELLVSLCLTLLTCIFLISKRKEFDTMFHGLTHLTTNFGQVLISFSVCLCCCYHLTP